MHSRCLIAVLGLSIIPAAKAQDVTHKPKVSSESLTKERAAVYRAAVQDFLTDSKGKLKVSNMTEPLDKGAKSPSHGCPKTSSAVAPDASALVVHRLDNVETLDPRVELVDSDRQAEEIKSKDPAILMKRVIVERENVPQKEIDDATEQAVRNGLFTLSEIVFNKEHNRAIVSYNFVCGERCGQYRLLILKKVGEKWKVHKTCEELLR